MSRIRTASGFTLAGSTASLKVIDYAQLIRVLNDVTAGIGAIDVDNPSTPNVVERLDPVNPRYIGQSLGGIIGTLIAAAVPELTALTLNVPRASMTDVILDSMTFSSQRAPLDTFLGSKGWPPGSQGYLRFLDLARWALDHATLFKNHQYPSGGHVFLLNIASAASATRAIQAQNDAVDWVKP